MLPRSVLEMLCCLHCVIRRIVSRWSAIWQQTLLAQLFTVLVSFSFAVMITLFVIATWHDEHSDSNTYLQPLSELQPPTSQHNPDYVAALRSRADASGFVILATFDESFVDLAANLYSFSFRRHGIHNFLFVGFGSGACSMLAATTSNDTSLCYQHENDSMASTESIYGSMDFIQKMHRRTRLITDALLANFSVLHTDVDVAFLKNPLPELKKLIQTTSIAAMWDHGQYNAGFLIVRPSALSLIIYESMLRLSHSSLQTVDQVALNAIIDIMHMRDRELKRANRIAFLDRWRFVCGRDYFDKRADKSGMEWNPLDTCGKAAARPCAHVVHNNWIVGKPAKIFRFREHMMWSHDPDGTHYADRTAVYLTYGFATPAGSARSSYATHQTVDAVPPPSVSTQLFALKTALVFGHLLNRIVIVPRFWCSNLTTSLLPDCPLISVVNISSFDQQFAGKYRESTFLHNPQVPSRIRNGSSTVQSCRVGVTGERQQTSVDIKREFGSRNDSVLIFDSFTDENCYPIFVDYFDGKNFELKLQRGIVSS